MGDMSDLRVDGFERLQQRDIVGLESGRDRKLPFASVKPGPIDRGAGLPGLAQRAQENAEIRALLGRVAHGRYGRGGLLWLLARETAQGTARTDLDQNLVVGLQQLLDPRGKLHRL